MSSAYLVAAIAIIATPGADVLLAVATALGAGRRAGMAAVVGMSSGYLTHAVLAAVGLAALLARSPGAIRVIEAFGAAYLLWAGVTQLRRRHAPPPTTEQLIEPFRRGYLTSVLNPKGTLFFFAFLPQFLPADGHHRSLIALLLGVTFAALTVVIYGGYALATSATRRLLAGPRAFVVMRTVAGLVFVGLGTSLALRVAHL